MDVRLAGFHPVDLQVRETKPVGELLPGQPLGDSNLLDSTSYQRWRIGHPSHLSDSDMARKLLSAPHRQARVNVGEVAAHTHDLSFAECERWVTELGLGWEDFLTQAKVGSDQYVLKQRWNAGSAPRDRQKVRDTLERLEAKRREPTVTGTVIAQLEEWNRLGRDLAGSPQHLAVEIARVRPIAEAAAARARAVEQLDDANATLAGALGSVTPTPRKSRR